MGVIFTFNHGIGTVEDKKLRGARLSSRKDLQRKLKTKDLPVRLTELAGKSQV